MQREERDSTEPFLYFYIHTKLKKSLASLSFSNNKQALYCGYKIYKYTPHAGIERLSGLVCAMCTLACGLRWGGRLSL